MQSNEFICNKYSGHGAFYLLRLGYFEHPLQNSAFAIVYFTIVFLL